MSVNKTKYTKYWDHAVCNQKKLNIKQVNVRITIYFIISIFHTVITSSQLELHVEMSVIPIIYLKVKDWLKLYKSRYSHVEHIDCINQTQIIQN